MSGKVARHLIASKVNFSGGVRKKNSDRLANIPRSTQEISWASSVFLDLEDEHSLFRC